MMGLLSLDGAALSSGQERLINTPQCYIKVETNLIITTNYFQQKVKHDNNVQHNQIVLVNYLQKRVDWVRKSRVNLRELTIKMR